MQFLQLLAVIGLGKVGFDVPGVRCVIVHFKWLPLLFLLFMLPPVSIFQQLQLAYLEVVQVQFLKVLDSSYVIHKLSSLLWRETLEY